MTLWYTLHTHHHYYWVVGTWVPQAYTMPILPHLLLHTSSFSMALPSLTPTCDTKTPGPYLILCTATLFRHCRGAGWKDSKWADTCSRRCSLPHVPEAGRLGGAETGDRRARGGRAGRTGARGPHRVALARAVRRPLAPPHLPPALYKFRNAYHAGRRGRVAVDACLSLLAQRLRRRIGFIDTFHEDAVPLLTICWRDSGGIPAYLDALALALNVATRRQISGEILTGSSGLCRYLDTPGAAWTTALPGSRPDAAWRGHLSRCGRTACQR